MGFLPRADVPALASGPSLSASACRSRNWLNWELGSSPASVWDGSAFPEMPPAPGAPAARWELQPSSPAWLELLVPPALPPSVSPPLPWSGSSWLLQLSLEPALGCQEQPLVHWAQQLLVLIKNGETQQLSGCDSPCCCWGQGRGGAGQPGERLDPQFLPGFHRIWQKMDMFQREGAP